MRNKLTKALCIIAVTSPAQANYVGVVGDVIARNLDQPGGGWAGHTGLATAPHYAMRPTLVLQAMADAPHIQEVSALTNDIIQRAKNEHGKARHQLLLMLQTIYQNKWNDKNAPESQAIINYFKEIQHDNLNKDDAGIIYRAMATLAPHDIRKGNLNLTHIDKIHVDIFSLKSDRVNELKYVQDIISNLDNPKDSLLRTASYKYLTELLINTDLKLFSDEGKELFKEHLSHKKMIDRTQSMLYTSAYIEFKATLNAKSLNDIPRLTTLYMKSLDEDIKQFTPYGFSDFTKNKLH